MQAGGEGEGSGVRGQPALQAGLWRQNWESAGGGGAVEEAQVKSTGKKEWMRSVGECTVGRVSCFQVLPGARAKEGARAEECLQAGHHSSERAPTHRELSEGTVKPRKLLLWSPFSVTQSIFHQQCTPDAPSVKRESSQLITGAEDKSSLSSSLYVHLRNSTSNQTWQSFFFLPFVTFMFLPPLI